MRIRITLIALLLTATGLLADTHIHVTDRGTWSTQALSAYVGQTVIFDDPIVVCSNANTDLVVSPWRMFEPRSIGAAGTTEYNTVTHVNSSCRMTLTGVSGYHRCGEKIYNLRARVSSTSSLSFLSGDWRGNTRSELEAGLPELGDYRLLVCGFNLENYFAVNFGSLGAASYSEHQKQRTKTRKALAKINADIFGLVELEKGDDALQEIVNDLNSAHPERYYTFFRENTPATATQKVDFVYDTMTVRPIGKPGGSDTEVQYRKKMICFEEKSTGERFIYSINHFKAMSGGGDTGSRRLNEARAVVNLYNQYRNGVGDDDILIMGDLNTYAKTDPVFVFTQDNHMIDLHRAFHADSSYSYMYGGLASYIDHAISNGSLYPQITGMAGYHINSDENDYYTYDKSSDLTMFRCSDHDPVLVGLALDNTKTFNPEPSINNFELISGEANELVIANAFSDKQPSYYAIYTISGTMLQQQQITDVAQSITLPADPGIYILYIYCEGAVYQRKFIIP